MTALQIIVSLITSVAYAGLIALCIVTFRFMKELQRKFDSLHGTQRMMFAMLTEGNIYRYHKEIKELAGQMQQAVDDDRFEDAEQLKKIIAERERYIIEQLAYIKSEFSNECEVRMYRTRADGKEE